MVLISRGRPGPPKRATETKRNSESWFAKRYDTIKVRLPLGCGDKLDDLCRDSGLSRTQQIAKMIGEEWDAVIQSLRESR